MSNFADEANDRLNGKASKKTKSKNKPLSKWMLDNVWDSRPIRWLAQALVIVCVAYTALDQLTNLTGLQQLQGAVALIGTALVINRAFKK